MLAFSRQQVLRLEAVDVNEVVLGIEDMLKRVIGEDVTIETRLADELAGVKADTTRLEQGHCEPRGERP